MKYIRQLAIILFITMIGELLNIVLPLPVPAGVYGLFLLLAALCTGLINVAAVEEVGGFLLDIMPLMFIPVSVGLIDSIAEMQAIAIPLTVITIISTIIVMAVTGKATEWIINSKENVDRQD